MDRTAQGAVLGYGFTPFPPSRSRLQRPGDLEVDDHPDLCDREVVTTMAISVGRWPQNTRDRRQQAFFR
jgi:hypothetical protein